jgi:hypothetical protein
MSRTKANSMSFATRKALRLIPIHEQFDSPIVAKHMSEIARLNEELRQWRRSRLGKRITRREIRFV